MFKPNAKLRTHAKCYNTKTSQLMTRECSNASANSPYHSTSILIERHDAPINMKLQSDSPCHPAKNQLKTCFREQKLPSNKR